MEGDLTLYLLTEASASGLLHNLQIDPFNQKDLVQLHQVLNRLSTERQKAALEHELFISTMQQVCMAVANHKEYAPVAKTTFQLRDALRAFIFPEEDIDVMSVKYGADNEDLMDMWEQVFGPAQAAEKRFAERQRRKKFDIESGLSGEVEQIVTQSLFKR